MRVMFGAAVFCCALLLPACGIKGPLYLPPVQPDSAAQPSTAQPFAEPSANGAGGETNPETRPESPSSSRHE